MRSALALRLGLAPGPHACAPSASRPRTRRGCAAAVSTARTLLRCRTASVDVDTPLTELHRAESRSADSILPASSYLHALAPTPSRPVPCPHVRPSVPTQFLMKFTCLPIPVRCGCGYLLSARTFQMKRSKQAVPRLPIDIKLGDDSARIQAQDERTRSPQNSSGCGWIQSAAENLAASK
ncbi:hypothetical protein B0H16DRAFT_1625197 [Mycena metata]|uniref:Uncharacterized protein n=1 Tax=Mycena metata TaxID=1033252 RepID=A0AAD7H5B9_9AGAR|nr:hypothetical protein B0H16DRAFT_1625197 [Mycena metata]